MRGVGIAAAVALTLALAGCFSAVLPPKELPDWAMSPQQAELAPARTAPSKRVRAARRVPLNGAPERSASVSYVPPSSAQTEVKPFSPEWQARESASDDRLRRRMRICGGC
jgi:hypothetical protein